MKVAKDKKMKGMVMDPATVNFTSYKGSINSALDAINAPEQLALQTAILVKPNLINSLKFPVF